MTAFDRQIKLRLLLTVALSCALSLALHATAVFAQSHLTKTEYQKIFSNALSAYLQGQGGNNMCLPLFLGSNGISLNQRQLELPQTSPAGAPVMAGGNLAAQLKALEGVGLVTSTDTERTINNKAETLRTFTKTAKGDQYYSNNRFCYGHAELEKIVKWRGPATFDEYRLAVVYFTTKMVRAADWINDPAVQEAFPSVKATIENNPPKVRQVIIDLTSEGWEVNDWSKFLE